MQHDPRLTEWHRIVAERDWTALDALLDEQVEFHSPFVWKPKRGKMAALFILSNVSEIFEDFTYHREWSDGDSLALEFSARVDGLGVKGIDLIRFNDQGRIVHFEVLIRPANGLMALGEKMGERLAAAGLA